MYVSASTACLSPDLPEGGPVAGFPPVELLEPASRRRRCVGSSVSAGLSFRRTPAGGGRDFFVLGWGRSGGLATPLCAPPALWPRFVDGRGGFSSGGSDRLLGGVEGRLADLAGVCRLVASAAEVRGLFFGSAVLSSAITPLGRVRVGGIEAWPLGAPPAS